MKISFTGTRKGMTENQKRLFLACLDRDEVEEFNHGDCIGADEDARVRHPVHVEGEAQRHPHVAVIGQAHERLVADEWP